MLQSSTHGRPEAIELSHEPDRPIGDGWLRSSTRIVEVQGQRRVVEPRVMQLLTALVREVGSVVGRDDLVDLCWKGRIVGDDAIVRCIAKARAALAGTGAEIETVPRVGYRLTLPAGRVGRGSLWPVVTAALIAAAVALFLWTRQPTSSPIAEPSTIAIGDFAAPSDRADLQAAARRIGPAVADTLPKIGVPTVSPNGSADAAYRVSGQISAEPAAVTALIKIDDARTGASLASIELALDPDEALTMGPKVAAAVADVVNRARLLAALTDGSTEPDERSRILTISMHLAAGHYLESETLARRLVRDRPKSRTAPFLLTVATLYALPQLPDGEKAAAVKRARMAASLAEQRLPRFGDLAVSRCKLYQADYARCEDGVRNALRIDPDAPTVRTQLALLLMNGDRLRDADALTSRALASEPFNPTRVIQRLYLIDLLDLKSEEADTWAYAQRYWPRLRFVRQRFISLMANARWSEAEEMVPQVLRVEAGARDVLPAVFAALQGPTSNRVFELETRCRVARGPAARMSCMAALSKLGRPRDAIAIAKLAFPAVEAPRNQDKEALFQRNGSEPGPLFLLWGNAFRQMRDDPSFTEFAQQAGLLAYWRKKGGPDFCARERVPVCAAIVLAKV